MSTSKITIRTIVNAPLSDAWSYWTQPEHITQWYFASDDWHCPKAINELKANGLFCYTMGSKDGEMTFDFSGIHYEVETNKTILSTLDDDRKVEVTFEDLGDQTKITEIFEPESTNSHELQKSGWQAILDNFKRYIDFESGNTN